MEATVLEWSRGNCIYRRIVDPLSAVESTAGECSCSGVWEAPGANAPVVDQAPPCRDASVSEEVTNHLGIFITLGSCLLGSRISVVTSEEEYFKNSV